MAKQSIKFNSLRGVEFLNQITLEINKETGADYTFVGEYCAKEGRVKTVSLCTVNSIVNNIEYGTVDTPCSEVLNAKVCIYPKGIQDLFPKDQFLVDMEIGGYVGYPLFSVKDNEMIGILVSLFKKEIENPDDVIKYYKYLVPRIEMELDRVLFLEETDCSKQKFKDLLTQNKQLTKLNEKIIESDKSFKELFHNSLEHVYIHEMDGSLIEINNTALEAYGYPKDFLIGKTPEIFDAPGLNDLSELQKNMATVSKGVPVSFEWWGKKKNDEVFLKEVNLRKGTYFGKDVIIAVARDITERLKNERSIQERKAENKYLTIRNNEYTKVNEVLGEENTKLEEIIQELFENKQDLTKRNNKLAHYRDVFIELAIDKNLSLTKTLEKIVRKASEALAVSRVSFWTKEKKVDGIKCNVLFDANKNAFESGMIIKRAEYPDYFDALEENKIIVANDASANPYTKEFSESYLKPLGVTSILDACVYIQGESIGIVCLEHVGEKRVWGIEEEQFALSIAGVISLASESDELKKAEFKTKESEEKYKSIYNSLIDVFFRLNADGVITEMSPSVQNVIGYEPSFYIGKKFLEKFTLSEKGKGIIESLKVDGRLSDVPINLIHKKGYKVQVEINVKINQDLNGEIVCVEGVARDVTERIKTLTKLKNSEEKFRAFSEQSLEPISIADFSGQYIFVNNAFCQLMGYSESELLDKTVYDMKLFPEDDGIFRESKNSKIYGEMMLKKKDGSTFLASIVGSSIVINKKNFVLGIVKDITKEKEIEKQLIESEELLRKSQEAAKIGSYSFDIIKGTWISSMELNNIFNLENTENVMSQWIEIIHPDDVDMMKDYLLLNVFQNHESFNKEYRILSQKNSIEKWVHGMGELEFDETGKAIRLYGTIQDITERKVIEQQLEESAKEIAYVRNALNQYSIVAITDVKGRIIHANENFCKISGYSVDELLGEDHRMLNSGYHSTAFFKDMWRTIENGEIWSSEVQNKSKSGKIYWVDTTIVPTLNEEGKPFQYVVIRNDITLRKHAEEKLNDLLLSKDVLLKEVHHRVKNNLQIISALLSLKETDNPEIQSFVKESNARIKSMALLHENIYQSEDIGKFTFKEYLTHLVSYLFDSYGAENTKISYVINVEDNINLRLKDAITLGLIVTEIITNALKYAFVGRDKGEVKVSFTDGDELIHLKIKDDGIGMDIKQNKKKTMGMLIITSLAKQLGGKLEVKGDDGVEYTIVYKNKGHKF